MAAARAAFYHLKAQWLRGQIDQLQARLRSRETEPQDQLVLAAEIAALTRLAREAAQMARLPASVAPF